MKKSIFKTLAIACTFGIVFVACENKEDELQDEQLQELQETPTKNAAYLDELSETSYEVAKIQKDGHEYHFIALGDEDEMIVAETLYGNASKNAEESLHSIEQSPFNLFIALTSNSVSVPERVAKTAKGLELEQSGRNIKKNGALLEIKDPNYAEAIDQKACYDIGATDFRNIYCGGVPVVSTPTDIRFCDNGLWTSLTRNSYYGGDWKELDDTYTRTNVVCGLTRLQFYAWENTASWPFSDWKWVLKYQVDLPNGYWYYYYYTSTNTERQVKRTRPTSSGSFRAYTRFY
ncbi:hypothetical protein J8L88_15055 [Aquimarina sp. MMG015]|uniref:hypothetical protein n=1 Tax=Aquimarina sp. MMG015 TaxID=2822689 RepID=UPI001B3A5947|nr:hypothetical protein [Aquimarina sp. MMG015]MBQ4804180.1 hypothetical protein [Aquimarina sp. MMG015]